MWGLGDYRNITQRFGSAIPKVCYSRLTLILTQTLALWRVSAQWTFGIVDLRNSGTVPIQRRHCFKVEVFKGLRFKRYSFSRETHLKAPEHHLPYEITHCTQHRWTRSALTQARQAGSYSIFLPLRDGKLSWLYTEMVCLSACSYPSK